MALAYPHRRFTVSNSLEELNGFSQAAVFFQDARPYTITVAGTPSNQAVSVGEDQGHTVPKGSWSITALQSVPGNVVMTIDASSVGDDFYVSWTTSPQIQNLDQGLSLTNPSPGVFVLTGLNGQSVFDSLSAPRVVAKDRVSDYSYTVSVTFPDPADPQVQTQLDYTVAVTVTSTHDEMSQPGSINWNEDDSTISVVNPPQITDEFVEPGTYNLTITPSDAAAVFRIVNAGQAASTFDLQTRVLTVSGTQTQVNNTLQNLTVVPAADYDLTFDLSYQLTNPISGLETVVVQTFTVVTTDDDFVLNDFDVYKDLFSPLSIVINDLDPDLPEYTVIVSTAATETTQGEFRRTTIEGPTAAQQGLTINPNYIRDREPGDQIGTILVDGEQTVTLSRITRADFNSQVIEYRQSANVQSAPGTQAFFYTQIKHDPVQGDIVQADRVPFTAVLGAQSVVLLNSSKTVREDGAVTVDYVVNEPYDPVDTNSYTLRVLQTNPEPVNGTTKGTFSVSPFNHQFINSVYSGVVAEMTLFNNLYFVPAAQAAQDPFDRQPVATVGNPGYNPVYDPKVIMIGLNANATTRFKYLANPNDPVDGTNIAYSPPPDFRNTANYQLQVIRNSRTRGAVDISPTTGVTQYTTQVTDTESPAAGFTLVSNTGTAYSAGWPNEFTGNVTGLTKPTGTGPAVINFSISDLDRVLKAGDITTARIGYSVRQVTPDPAVPGSGGWFGGQGFGIVNTNTGQTGPNLLGQGGNDTFGTTPLLASGNAQLMINAPGQDLVANDHPGNQPTVVFNPPGTSPQPAAVDGATPPGFSSSVTNSNRVQYWAPPGFAGTVTLELDIFKIRSGDTLLLADAVPITVTVPQDNQGPAGNNFLPVSTIDVTRTMPTGEDYSFESDMALVDPGGGMIDRQTFSPSRYNFTITQSEVKGLFRFRNVNTNASSTIGQQVNFQNLSQTEINRYLNLQDGTSTQLEFAPIIPGSPFPGTPTSGPLTLNLTVQRIYQGVTTTIAERQINYIIQ